MTVYFTSQFIVIPLKCLEILCLTRMMITLNIILWERIQSRNTCHQNLRIQLSKNMGCRSHQQPRQYLTLGLVCCMECCNPKLIYSKSKLKPNEIEKLKRSLNEFHYICGFSFHEIVLDDHASTVFRKKVSRENIACESKMEQLYYSCIVFKAVLFYCGKSGSLSNDGIHSPQCKWCKDKPNVITQKWKSKDANLHKKKAKIKISPQDSF